MLYQADGNEIQHDFLGHVVPLVLVSVSCDAAGSINGTID